MTKVRNAISCLIDCAEAAKGTEFADYYLMGADAIRAQQDHFRDSTQMVAPLTLDELRKMDEEPVWVVYDEDAGMRALVEVLEEQK